MKGSRPQNRIGIGAFCICLLVGALLPNRAFAQSGVSYFTVSEIGDPRPWRPGEVTVGKNIGVTITARDASGSRVRSFDGPVFISQFTDYGVGRTAPEIVNLNNGRWEGSLKVFRAGKKSASYGVTGDVWIQVTDNAPNPHFGNSNLFVARPKEFSRLLIVAPGEQHLPGSVTGRTGQPFKQTTGEQFFISVLATDAYWNGPADVSHTVHLVSSDPNAILQQNTPMDDGEVSMIVRFNSVGQQTITAFDVNDPSHVLPHTSSNITVDSGLPSTVQGFAFDPISSPRTAGEELQLTIRAVDGSGLTVDTYNEPATLSASTGPGTIQVGNVVFVNGIWSGSVVLTKAAQNVRLTVRDFSGDLSSEGNLFAVVPGPVARLQILLPGESTTPGLSPGKTGVPEAQFVGASFSIQVLVTDSWWNLTQSGNLSLDFSSSDPQANLPNNPVQNVAQASYSVSLVTAGHNRINVEAENHSTLTETYISSLVFVDSGLIDHFAFSAIDVAQVAGRPFGVTIEARDRNGNMVPNYNDDVILFASTGNGTISETGVTMVNGSWTGELFVTKADANVTLFAADFVAPPNTHSGSSNSFSVSADSLSGFQVLLPGQSATSGVEPGFSGTPETKLAGEPVKVTVRSVDRYWNLIQDNAELLGISVSDDFAALADTLQLVNGSGEVTVVFREAVSHRVSVQSLVDETLPTAESNEVLVNANAFSQLLILLPGETLLSGDNESNPQNTPGRSGVASSQTSGLPFDVEVYAVDDFFNPILDAPSDQVRLIVTDNQALVSPADTVLINGYAQFTVTPVQGGNQVLRAVDESNSQIAASLDGVVTVLVGGLHYEVEVQSNSVQAGGDFVMHVFYRNGIGENVVSANQLVRLTAVSASNLNEEVATLENSSFNLQAGQRTVSQVVDKAGFIRIKVEDDLGTEPAFSDPVTVTAGSAASLDISAAATEVGGMQTTDIEVTLRDASGNPVSGQEVQFSLLSGSGILEQNSATTDTLGVASVGFRAGQVTETNRIRATAESLSTDIEIVVNLTQSDLPDGVVVNYPNPFGAESEITSLDYYLSEDADVTLRIFDLLGNLVWSQDFPAGTPGGIGRGSSTFPNSISWDGENESGQKVGNGSYILLAKGLANGKVVMNTKRKIVVLR